jgi:hypothetical protein
MAVAVGLTIVGFLMVSDSRSEIGDLVSVAQRAERAELVRFAGGEPDRCVYAGPERELCRWQIDGTVLVPSGSTPVKGPVMLVCELPANLASSESGSCFVRGREALGDSELPPVSAPGTRVQQARHAAGILAESRTIGELSLLVGDAPETCQTVYAAQVCRWALPQGSGAHQRLAALAEGQGDLELRCLLPLEQAERLAQSCAVVSVE